MRPKVSPIISVVFFLGVTISLLDPTGIYVFEAYGQKYQTEKEWLTCRKKLEIMVDKEKIGTPGFESAVVEICGKRPGKSAKEGPASGPASSKADLPFKIDCTELDAERQAICKSYVATTRDEVYPHLRDLTGTSLSSCYDSIFYKIIPGDPKPGAGGVTSRNRITYNQIYSVDLKPPYDVHELLHSFSHCNGALDEHVFHGAMMSAVYVRMGRKPQYSKEFRLEDQKRLIKLAETSEGAELYNRCRGILGDQLALVYFDNGEEAVKRLYRSTISPRPVSKPSQQLVKVWGPSVARVQALLEVLKKEYKSSFSVPACGY